MSCWWDVTFCAIGSNERLEELKSDIWNRYDSVGKVEFLGVGVLCATLDKNYGGEEAIKKMVAAFQDLDFIGTLVLLQSLGYEEGFAYETFVGMDGETGWRVYNAAPREQRVGKEEPLAMEPRTPRFNEEKAALFQRLATLRTATAEEEI
jgi:hypothetical protein